MILSDPLSDSSIKSSLKVVGKPWTAVTEFPIVGGWWGLEVFMSLDFAEKNVLFIYLLSHKGEWESR